jgi:hypothetical protein
VKPQYVDQIPKAVRTPDKSVKALIESRRSLDNLDEVLDTLGKPTRFLSSEAWSTDSGQSCATSTTVMSHFFLVVSFSVLLSAPSVCRRPMCKPLPPHTIKTTAHRWQVHVR